MCVCACVSQLFFVGVFSAAAFLLWSRKGVEGGLACDLFVSKFTPGRYAFYVAIEWTGAVLRRTARCCGFLCVNLGDGIWCTGRRRHAGVLCMRQAQFLTSPRPLFDVRSIKNGRQQRVSTCGSEHYEALNQQGLVTYSCRWWSDTAMPKPDFIKWAYMLDRNSTVGWTTTRKCRLGVLLSVLGFLSLLGKECSLFVS